MDLKLLHLGCGQVVGRHWTNIDSSLNVILDNHRWLARILRPILPSSSKTQKFVGVQRIELRAAWPYASQSFDAIFSSHFLEHLSLSDAKHVLKECFRVLKPGGQIRFIVPCLEAEIAEYLREKNAGTALAATRFGERTCIFPEYSGAWWYRLYCRFYDKNSHKMLYDYTSLEHYFNEAGFENAKRSNFLDSSIPHLDEVELKDRYERATCIEARKPRVAGSLPQPKLAAAG